MYKIEGVRFANSNPPFFDTLYARAEKSSPALCADSP